MQTIQLECEQCGEKESYFDKKPPGWTTIKLHVEVMEGSKLDPSIIDTIKDNVSGKYPYLVLCPVCCLSKDSWTFNKLFKAWISDVPKANPKS